MIFKKANNEPYPQLRHKIKMAAIVGGLCTESLWRGYRFAMNDIKKSKNISGEAYIQSSNANVCVLLNLSIFWLVFIISGELVLDDCIYMPHLKGFWISYSVTLTSP